MASTSPANPARKRANALLAAWYSGDVLRLETALRTAYSSDKADADQSEREEMLAAAEAAIRRWLRNPETDAEDLRVSLRLLRHLAGLEFSTNAARLHVPAGPNKNA